MNSSNWRRFGAVVLVALLAGMANGADSARQIVDLNPGPTGSFPTNLTSTATGLYFSAYTFSTGQELWKFTGSEVVLATNINDTADEISPGLKEGNDSVPSWLTEFNGQLYFSAFDPRRGGELWRYNGSEGARVADLNPDMDDKIKPFPNSSWPSELTELNNALYFSANTGSAADNYELWKYDGNAVTQVANLRRDSGPEQSSYPNQLTVFNGALYFMADDGTNGFELWRHDGTSTTGLNINPGGPESSSYPKNFTPFNNQLYFQAYTSAAGYELWKTDGSTVALAADIEPGAESSYPEFFTAFNGALFFRATDSAHGSELWRFDGNEAMVAADLNLAGDSYPKNLTVFGNALIFAANDGVHGWELWKYDAAGAALIADLNPAGDSFPENFAVVNGVLYFSATTPETGYEIFKFDGTSVSLSADINPGAGSSFPQVLTAHAGQLFFRAADDGTSNWELWTLSPGSDAEAPQFASIARAGNAIELTVTGTSGVAHVLEGSSDLSNWTPVETKTPAGGSVTFTDLISSQYRFYRVTVR